MCLEWVCYFFISVYFLLLNWNAYKDFSIHYGSALELGTYVLWDFEEFALSFWNRC